MKPRSLILLILLCILAAPVTALAIDSDGDGLDDAVETTLGTDPFSFDTDGDGIDDFIETDGGNAIDTDGDATIDALDLDSDQDGIPDATEGVNNSDGDPLPDYRDPDDDNDNIPTAVEGAVDSDGDTVPDYLDSDSDQDGYSDLFEGAADTDGDTVPDYLDLDSDGDNIPDSQELFEDSDGDGIYNLKDSDDDQDGIPTTVEGGPTDDADQDGIPNYLDLDSDQDGYLDSDPLEGLADDDNDGIPNFLDPDSPGIDTDGDGLVDPLETSLGTDPLNPDSDNDGIDDFVETDGGNPVNTDGDAVIDALDTDSDNDQIPDATEGVADSDGDTLPDYRDDDDDGDTIPTATEGTADVDNDGIPNYLDDDSDADGYLDADEAAAGSDPYDPVSTPLTVHGAVISGIVDVGNDQGRRVRITWSRSDFDIVGSAEPILSYSIYRRVDGNKTAAPGAVSHTKAGGVWDFVLNLPATGSPDYAALAGTLCDSTTAGICWSVFFVRAHTAVPTSFHDSPPDSGYSVDNLAPNVPQGFQVAYATDNSLVWQPSEDEDFRYFNIYRGVQSGFTPDPGNLLVSTTGTGYIDAGAGAGVHYLITAVDFAGNESDPAAPESVSGVEGGVPSAFGLEQNTPNPFNPRTTIRFSLARTGPVTLRIYDVSGRLVRSIISGQVMDAGTHSVVWDGVNDEGQPVSSGVYFYGVRSGDDFSRRRMALVR